MKRIFEHRSDLVRPKKALGQHFLTDLSVAQKIADALVVESETVGGAVPEAGAEPADSATAAMPVLEIGPGMGVLSQYLLGREDIDLRMIEIDRESVDYLLTHFPKAPGRVIEGDFLKMDLKYFFPGTFAVIGNFPYNISSQIFFRIIDHKDSIPQVVCMIQKEVAERIAEQPGSKTYGILSVLLQAWYDIEYLFTVGEGAFNPPPKVKSAVIRLRRNSRTELGCDEKLFKTIVKTGFNQRRKTLRNSLKPLIADKAAREAWTPEQSAEFLSNPVFELRPERLSVEDFIALTKLFS
ncbi:MAG: 16S rRNA (adenine(1518)-N(6)/adenine(1519)-N(6))-dimethyltransferase RsmA [Candidatus Cryptobacteroides sp.]|nr:16S rRNA (adenine(1518)-N(6)/adenine(1519)-N(6))-dimethyltransferase RsmA [Bacteroidales bacterium]MDD7134248.1 16S rRNA (adenine(1518)-N(6)/adenine(1519)-N(6))-dimethyltransferase RsmA [Bacteroidales bacterium]MDY2774665.1 16S rRNA (adenine(1518)-N(6)/adenine(1519)-N(6))-dimethyltransferase RsmA [Candidatus Cryptobacteroides sp.]